MNPDSTLPPASPPETASLLPPLEARVLGCLIEKELATPEAYPLTLNALVNACNQRSNRDPLMEVAAREVEAALDGLRHRRLAALVTGADARVPRFKQKLDGVYPMTAAARALLGELLLRGPQTFAGLRANAERMGPLPPAGAAFDALVAELSVRTAGPLVRLLPRQPGQKEARWAQLLAEEPPAGPAAAEPLKVSLALPPEVAQRLDALEAEIVRLRTELERLRAALGGN